MGARCRRDGFRGGARALIKRGRAAQHHADRGAVVVSVPVIASAPKRPLRRADGGAGLRIHLVTRRHVDACVHLRLAIRGVKSDRSWLSIRWCYQIRRPRSTTPEKSGLRLMSPSSRSSSSRIRRGLCRSGRVGGRARRASSRQGDCRGRCRGYAGEIGLGGSDGGRRLRRDRWGHQCRRRRCRSGRC